MENFYKGIDLRDLLGYSDRMNCAFLTGYNLDLKIGDKIVLIKQQLTVYNNINDKDYSENLERSIIRDSLKLTSEEYYIRRIFEINDETQVSNLGGKLIYYSVGRNSSICDWKYIVIDSFGNELFNHNKINIIYNNLPGTRSLDAENLVVTEERILESKKKFDDQIQFRSNYFKRYEDRLNYDQLLSLVGTEPEASILVFNNQYFFGDKKKMPTSCPEGDLLSFKPRRVKITLNKVNRKNSNGSIRVEATIGGKDWFVNIYKDGFITERGDSNLNDRYHGYITLEDPEVLENL